MIRRSRHRRSQAQQELNITAFMNLMVILVPFLLVTAVFSRIAIIELGLPAAGAADRDDSDRLSLEVTVRHDRIELSNRGGQPLVIGMRDGEYNLKSLSDMLKRVKAEFPDHAEAMILLEPDISYDVLVQVMDTVRSVPVVQASQVSRVDLFPAISIGDAVPRDRKG